MSVYAEAQIYSFDKADRRPITSNDTRKNSINDDSDDKWYYGKRHMKRTIMKGSKKCVTPNSAQAMKIMTENLIT